MNDQQNNRRGDFPVGKRRRDEDSGPAGRRGIVPVSGEMHEGLGRAHGHGPSVNKSNCIADPVNNVVSAASTEPSSTANDPESNTALMKNQQNNFVRNIVTILPWPDPKSHYIPIEEEERLLPVLIHWGRSERGMMKDQPPFRLKNIQKILESQINRGKCHGDGENKKSSNQPSSTIHSTTHRMSLVQSLSLRRHHLKLLNPNLSMSTLRLGREKDIRGAARQFELCVDAYLRRHGVHFLTEDAQQSKFLQISKSKPSEIRNVKQPPSPDFMIKEGHTVMLSFSSDCKNSTEVSRPIINWIEVKMFYGANSIPSGTPNAVGCILPKMQQYVSLYGAGAIVFMYGCGSRLAEQLMEVGVVALDGRCLDLVRVEDHQRKWCADSWGNILF